MTEWNVGPSGYSDRLPVPPSFRDECDEESADLRKFDPTKKKKKKERREKPVEFVVSGTGSVPLPTTEGLEPESWIKDDVSSGKERDYIYAELLKRLYDRISSRNDDPSGQRRHIDPPEVGRVGTKRVAWINFYGNCKSINRQPAQVLDFVLAELGTTGSIAADNKLIIRGRFQPKQLENLLKKYIAEYVTCKTCKSPDTSLKKENRLLFKVCASCGSSTSVAPVQSGFKQGAGKKENKE